MTCVWQEVRSADAPHTARAQHGLLHTSADSLMSATFAAAMPGMHLRGEHTLQPGILEPCGGTMTRQGCPHIISCSGSVPECAFHGCRARGTVHALD